MKNTPLKQLLESFECYREFDAVENINSLNELIYDFMTTNSEVKNILSFKESYDAATDLKTKEDCLSKLLSVIDASTEWEDTYFSNLHWKVIGINKLLVSIAVYDAKTEN